MNINCLNCDKLLCGYEKEFHYHLKCEFCHATTLIFGENSLIYYRCHLTLNKNIYQVLGMNVFSSEKYTKLIDLLNFNDLITLPYFIKINHLDFRNDINKAIDNLLKLKFYE